MSSREDDAQQADLKFERGIMTHVIGTLLAWGLGLLAYMMFVLWQDYISTILTSFIVAQTLHKQQAQLVGLIRLLRHPNEQSLLQAALGVIRRPIRGLQWIVFDVPALLQLALLLVVLIVQGMHTWVRIGLYLAGPAAALLLAIFLFDKKLLRFNAVVSDEVLAATLVLATTLSVLAFVATTLAVQSVLDGVQLIVSGSTWMRDVSSDAAGPVRAVVAQGVELGVASLEQLKQLEHQWVPVISHLVEQVGSPDRNGTLVVMSTFDKLRECYPRAAWISQAEDLSKLILWTAAAATHAAATNGTSAGGGFDVARLLEEGRKLALELEQPAELLALVRVQAAAAWPTLHSSLLDSQGGLLALISSAVAKVLTLLNLLMWVFVSFGGKAVVFLTMTFYMLSSEQDILTALVDKVHPSATSETLQRMRDTIDAVIITPFAGAARNAIFSLVVYWCLGLPGAHVAALGVVIFTLFPLTYAWVVCVPWVAIWCASGHWFVGLTLISVMVAVLSGHSEAELRLQEQAGISDYVHAFSLVLGVYVFGLQGVLFGPMLVCVAKMLWDMASDAIRTTEGRVRSPNLPEGSSTDEMPPPAPEPAVRQRAAARGSQEASEAFFPSGSGLHVPPPDAHPSHPSANRYWSRALLLERTMRRLSFFSSPGASPAHFAGLPSHPRSRACSGGGVSAGAHPPACPSLLRSQSHGVVPTYASPAHAAAVTFPDGDVTVLSIAVSLPSSAGCAGTGVRSIRVTAPSSLAWGELLRRVESRLLAVGAMGTHKTVHGLRAADGCQIVSAEDLRDGERVEAELATAGVDAMPAVHPAALFQSPHQQGSRGV